VQFVKDHDVASRTASILEEMFASETRFLHNKPPLTIKLSNVIVWVAPVIVTSPRSLLLCTNTTISVDKPNVTPPDVAIVFNG